jgi:ATP-dependent helicase IRC3
MVASLETGIVTTPTLFGLDPQELVDEARVDDLRDRKDRKEEEKVRQRNALSAKTASAALPRNITFTDYDSVFDLIADTSEDMNIRAMSPHAWVCVGQDKYILANSSGSYLRIERYSSEETYDEKGDGYLVTEIVVLHRSVSKAPFMKPRQISKVPTFADALHAADTYAKAKYPVQFISRRQAWRKGPATEGQLAFLNKLREKDDQLTADTLTKGKAGDMITKLKHGARGRFANIEADRRRLGRLRLKVEQEQALKEREQVNVGPLTE